MPFKNPLSRFIERIRESQYGYELDKIAKTHPVAPEISYPCYKSMDKFIDVEQLKALDPLLTEYINTNLVTKEGVEFPTGPITLKFWQPKTTAAHFIFITEPIGEYDYFNIDNPSMWKPSIHAQQLPALMAFIKTLPFKQTARIMIIYDTGGHIVTPHRDHMRADICHEFIWFRTNFNKKFYMLRDKKELAITSYSAWFDTVNQFHGAHAATGLNFSFRVDGIFNDEFRKLIPTPPINPASTAAYWASIEKNK